MPRASFGIKLEAMLGMNFYPCLAFPFSPPSLVCPEHHLYTTWTKVISKPTSGKHNPRHLLILKPVSQGRDAQTGPPELRAINRAGSFCEMALLQNFTKAHKLEKPWSS